MRRALMKGRNRIPRYFQKLNDLFNLGEFKWETGKNKVEDGESDILLNEKNNKMKDGK